MNKYQPAQKRIVHVMHKQVTAEMAAENPKLTVGALATDQVLTFPRTGDAYEIQKSGAVVSAKPKRWKNKAERKRFMRERRTEKQQQPTEKKEP